MRSTRGSHVDTAVELLMPVLCWESVVVEHLEVLFLNNDAARNAPALWGVNLINICITVTLFFLL